MADLGRLQTMKLVNPDWTIWVQAGSRCLWILESQSNVRQKVLVAFS